MPKTTTLADKTILLEKMERDRQLLSVAPARRVPMSTAGAAWAKAAALTAGAALPWPGVLRQPLRAMAAVAMRERFAELLRRSHVRRASDHLTDPVLNPDLARLASKISEVHSAAERGADLAEIEALRVQLDAAVRDVRARRAARVGQPLPLPKVPG